MPYCSGAVSKIHAHAKDNLVPTTLTHLPVILRKYRRHDLLATLSMQRQLGVPITANSAASSLRVMLLPGPS
jgi:hypothetical protein